jgi:hypothetical protein
VRNICAATHTEHHWRCSKSPLPLLLTTICAIIHKNFSYFTTYSQQMVKIKSSCPWMRSNAITTHQQHSWSILYTHIKHFLEFGWKHALKLEWMYQIPKVESEYEFEEWNGLYTITKSLIARLHISYMSMRNTSVHINIWAQKETCMIR